MDKLSAHQKSSELSSTCTRLLRSSLRSQNQSIFNWQHAKNESMELFLNVCTFKVNEECSVSSELFNDQWHWRFCSRELNTQLRSKMFGNSCSIRTISHLYCFGIQTWEPVVSRNRPIFISLDKARSKLNWPTNYGNFIDFTPIPSLTKPKEWRVIPQSLYFGFCNLLSSSSLKGSSCHQKPLTKRTLWQWPHLCWFHSTVSQIVLRKFVCCEFDLKLIYTGL